MEQTADTNHSLTPDDEAKAESGPTAPPSNNSHLLNLPLELRRKIYSYILPSTRKTRRYHETEYLWIRRSTSLLRTCHQLHEECLDILYGTNTFVIDIRFDSVKFRHTWLTPKGLTPKILYDFPKPFARSGVAHIRRYVVTVHHVDSYSGMIKYNCGGPMLTAGIKERAKQFVRDASTAPQLTSLLVCLSTSNPVLKDIRRVRSIGSLNKRHALAAQSDNMVARKDTEAYQDVLGPFALLHAANAEVSGSLSTEFQQQLTKSIMCSHKPDATDGDASESPLRPAVPWRWKMNWNA